MTLPRFELTISPHVKNRDYFAFLQKSSGHRDTPHKTGTNGHPRVKSSSSSFNNQIMQNAPKLSQPQQE